MSKHEQRAKSGQAGVTLIEMLVVVTIIALFAVLVGPNLFKQADKARTTAARAQLEFFDNALLHYKTDTGVFPNTEQGLAALRVKPNDLPTWNGPYLRKDVPVDPWGHPYIYKYPGRARRGARYHLLRRGWPAGRRGHQRRHRELEELMRRSAGITLIEMLAVVAIISLILGITFPSAMAGLDGIRLSGAAGDVAAFLNGALNRAERRQQVVEVSIAARERTLWLHSTEPGFERKMTLPDGISIVAILPRPLEEVPDPRNFIVLPGGTPPRIGVELASQRGARRLVRVDPITGVPRIERPEAQ